MSNVKTVKAIDKGYLVIPVVMTNKMVKILDQLVKEGDYRNRQDFISEAVRSHLNIFYPKKWNPEG